MRARSIDTDFGRVDNEYTDMVRASTSRLRIPQPLGSARADADWSQPAVLRDGDQSRVCVRISVLPGPPSPTLRPRTPTAGPLCCRLYSPMKDSRSPLTSSRTEFPFPGTPLAVDDLPGHVRR